ncbi:MAG: 50S ribosomal protein L15 [candidate division NC10 bacterium]|nr:50S ribosomal protein L15 [candidate division NC10 bacterium]
MKLHELKRVPGSRHRVKRVGRGPGSGHGKTSTKGHKGQKARSGGGKPAWFEGGQLPLHRRVPKRGFHRPFRQVYAVVNLKDLERFEAGARVTPEQLKETGLIKQLKNGVKILGEGEIHKPLHIVAHKFSRSAVEKIQQAGGTVEVFGG